MCAGNCGCGCGQIIINDPVGIPGDSAYQIWLDLGNTGTEQDFIDSLEGASGANGNNGTTIIQSVVGGPGGGITVGATYEVIGFLVINPATVGFADNDVVNAKAFITTDNLTSSLYPTTSLQLVLTSTLPVIGSPSTGFVVFTYSDFVDELQAIQFDVNLIRSTNTQMNVIGSISQLGNLQAVPTNLTSKINISPQGICVWSSETTPNTNNTFYLAIQAKVTDGTFDLAPLVLLSEYKKQL